ncbi:hypothetical protein B0J12DRAFT_627642 [Macrophomina phaseolina]|uniref:Uncharacterized protein n=1 Tax=Macrophomina phaseolina TaxID=35725 RepID=A0ABQ8G6A3_9PEZI|nr:hypothetical protein B0J12DRAFT_627642 [Macrophomina phaseolina]
MSTKQTSPFLRLPTEIRLMIYEELLLPPTSNEPRSPNGKFVAPIYREDELSSSSSSTTTTTTAAPSHHHPRAPRTLQIRTIDPAKLSLVLPPHSTRPTYHIRDVFRRSTQATSFALANNPGLHPSILSTCRQCHAEAAELLYGGAHAFDFDTHIEAIVPFFSALTPLARSFVCRVALVKRALTLCKEFDRAEWRAAFDYMARELNVAALGLSLRVVAGKPSGEGGWEEAPTLTAEHFRLIQPRSVRSRPASGDGGGSGGGAIAGVDFEWVGQLLWLRGLRDIQIEAIVEHCPTPMSETMAFWVSFSKSVEAGFRDWVRGVMLA